MRLLSVVALFTVTLTALPLADAKVEKLTLASAAGNHSYYLFVPDRPAGTKMPLLLLLHGSGRNGKSLIDPWLPFAKSEGIVLVAPDASDTRAWRFPQEGPDFFRDLIDEVRKNHDLVDPRRMYLFGHSAGAIHGLDLGVMESEYFAAVAVHAGVLSPEVQPIMEQAPRKIPLAIWIGTRDEAFPLDAVRRSRDLLTSNGFDVQFTVIPNHTHDYYSTAAKTNKEAWAFLSQHALTADPKFQEYETAGKQAQGSRLMARTSVLGRRIYYRSPLLR